MFKRKRAQVAEQADKLMDEAWEEVDWRSINKQAKKARPRDAFRQFNNVANAVTLRETAIKRLKKAIEEAHLRGERVVKPHASVFTELKRVSNYCDTPTSIVSTVAACNAVAHAHLNAAQPSRDSYLVLLSCWRLLGKYQGIPQ